MGKNILDRSKQPAQRTVQNTKQSQQRSHMYWWDSFETLSKLQTGLAILVSILGVVTLTVKLRADQLKNLADAQRTEERIKLDKALEDKTSEALRAAAALDARTAPRTISDEQRALFVRSLKDAPKGRVTMMFTADNAESHGFAIQVKDLLLAAGYIVPDLMIPVSHLGAPLIGAQFEAKNRDHPPAFAVPLQVCLKRIGVNALGANGSTDQTPDDLRLHIGLKP